MTPEQERDNKVMQSAKKMGDKYASTLDKLAVNEQAEQERAEASKKIAVTISRLPESLLDELEEHVAQLHDEYELDPDQMNTLKALIIGYGAAWDSLDREEQLQTQVEQLIAENERLKEREFNHYPIVIHELESRIFELQDKAAKQDKENKELRDTLGVIHYELTDLERLLEIPERGFVRNSFNSVLRWVEPYRTE